jgi:transposase
MSHRELSRLEVVQRVRRRTLTQRRAAELLSLSVRQVKRLCRAYKAAGAPALVSRRRGHPSNNRLAPQAVSAALGLLRTRYPDFGPTLAQEKLCQEHGLRLSVESVRQLMIRAGLWQVRRARKPVIHQLRERRARLGELIQIDGSPHDWFEGRAPKCTLLVLVDDATSRLMHLSLVEAETTFNYFAAVRAYVRGYGKPRAFYSDKFSVFRPTRPAALSGTGLTQFGRAMRELSIGSLCAHSPQAKGRVERANQTLQDRLTKELRLRSLSGLAEANAYLPEFMADYNARFARPPRSAEDAHRPLGAGEHLGRILTVVERRVLSKNLTLSYGNVIYQIKTRRPAYTMRHASVEVREAGSGEISIEYKGRALAYSIYAEQARPPVTPRKLLDAALGQPAGTVKRHGAPPPPSHPWKRYGFSRNSLQAKAQRGDICTLRK